MRDWEKLARACRRYLDAFNDEIADDITIGSVGNDLRLIAIREVQPDSETDWQWGIRVHDGSIMPLIHGDTEARARGMQASSKRGAVVVRREVGPWIEVTS